MKDKQQEEDGVTGTCYRRKLHNQGRNNKQTPHTHTNTNAIPHLVFAVNALVVKGGSARGNGALRCLARVTVPPAVHVLDPNRGDKRVGRHRRCHRLEVARHRDGKDNHPVGVLNHRRLPRGHRLAKRGHQIGSKDAVRPRRRRAHRGLDRDRL